MSEDVAVAERDGGMGNDRARLKRWITVCRDERTCRRVRRRGNASGSSCGTGGSGGTEGLRDDAGELGFRVRVGDGGTSGGEVAASRLWGTNDRIASSRPPREESESARERVSPRRSSTS